MTGVYLSIDFEDFSHDLKRVLGVWDTGPLKVDALWKSFSVIEEFLCKNGGEHGTRATFFCTGILAEKAPDLIAHIAGQGHEIACHYHFHDSMHEQSNETIDMMLSKAKDVLQTAANTPVIGFRAPRFHLKRDHSEQYKLIERHFSYDSSSFFSSSDECDRFAHRMGLADLKLLPLYSEKLNGHGPNIRLGGSYLKFAPLSVADKLIRHSAQNGIVPQIYLHPYEFVSAHEFMVPRSELTQLGAAKSRYWALRQNQWLRFGGDQLLSKVTRLIPREGLAGRLDQLI